MATTTARKAARYVRGSDGVYRRKTNDDGSSSLSQFGDQDSQELLVDKLINELIDCGPVEDPLRNPLRTLPNAETHQHQNTSGSSLPDTIRKGQLGTPSMDSFFQVSTNASNLTVGQNNVDQVVSEHRALASIEQCRHWLSGIPLEKVLDWGIPFGLGMVSMYVLQAMLPTLLHYGGVAAHCLKLVLLYGVFTLAVLWYFGVIKLTSLRDWHGNATKTTSDFFGKFSVLAEPQVSPVPVSSKIKPEIVGSDFHSVTDIGSISSSLPKTAPQDSPESVISDRLVQVRPFIPPHREISPERPGPGRPRVRRISTDIKDVGKSKFRSRFSPVRLSRDGRRHSSASLGGYKETNDAHRDTHEFKDINGDIRGLSRDARDFKDANKFYKPLPPVIKMQPRDFSHESDLPLVYEVKLKSLEDEDPNYAALDRLGTVMSKKSVLGTRANYLKFLSNVDD